MNLNPISTLGRKSSLAFLSLILSGGLAYKGCWDALGWAAVLGAILIPHNAANVMDSANDKRLKDAQ